MRILITAGGTSEKIDQVRSITNHSTGSLGRAIANAFLAHGASVDYVTTAVALRPAEQAHLTFYTIEDTQSLADTLRHLLATFHYDAVIHSMAVSDFTPAQSLSQEVFLERINALVAKQETITAEHLADLMATTEQETKISSNTDHLFLILKKTPKVIQQIKQKQPQALLVGFKLLVDVSKEELFTVAKASMAKSQADFVLANDLTSIKNNQHTGFLLNKTGELVGQADSKAEIAQLIVRTISDAL